MISTTFLRRVTCSRVAPTHRVAFLSTTGNKNESGLAALRRKTGFALNLCKKALTENENDVTRAEKWLKAEAMRNGWQKATQLQNRRAAEGLIGVYVNGNSRSGVLLEVNCESDFVSRNDIFRNLVADMTLKMASATIVRKNEVPRSDKAPLKKYPIAGADLEPFKDSLAMAITQLGENIKLCRATLIENRQSSGDSGVKLQGYAHAVGGQANVLNGVSLGKYGTVIAYKELPQCSSQTSTPEPISASEQVKETQSTEKSTEEEAKDGQVEQEEAEAEFDPNAFEVLEQNTSSLMGASVSSEQMAKLLCQHIIGLKPKTLAKVSDGSEDQGKETLQDSETKNAVKNNDEESEALLDQKFLINESLTVRQVCADKNLEIVDFERFECGGVQEEAQQENVQ